MGKKIDPTKVADLDDKTRNIFHAKGYIIDTMVGAGSYGEVSVVALVGFFSLLVLFLMPPLFRP